MADRLDLDNFFLSRLDIRMSLVKNQPPQDTEKAEELQNLLNQVNSNLLILLTHPVRQAAEALSNFVTCLCRLLKDKLINFAFLDASGLGITEIGLVVALEVPEKTVRNDFNILQQNQK